MKENFKKIKHITIKVISKFFFLFYISTCLNTHSQNFTINKGEITKDRQFLMDKSEITVSDKEGNFVSIRPHRNNGALHNYFVEFFKDLNFSNRIEIETKNKSEILDVFILNKKVHVFIKEEFDKTISLRFDIIDIDSKSQTQKILYEIDKESSPEIYDSSENNDNIYLEYSSQIVLTIPVIKDKIKYAFIKIFSSELRELSQHKIYADETLNFRDTNFLNTSQYNNKIYLLFNLIYNKDRKIYKIIELNNGNERVLEIPINTTNNELIYSKTKNSHLIICGLYSEDNKDRIEGFTYYNIDLESFTISSQKQNRFFSEDAQNYFKGLFKNNRSIDVKKVFIDEELNTYVIGQFYLIRKQNIPIGIPIAQIGSSVFITFNPISIRYKIYDDILIGKISSTGKLLWDKVLELRQTEKISSKSNKRDTSTFTFFSKNKINILMNGYINMKKNNLIVEQDKRLSKTNFYNITINSDGYISPNIIFSNKDSEIIFRAEETIRSNDKLHILGQGNMRKQLLELKL